MGGDEAPIPEVEGAAAAVRERALDVILVGDEDRLRRRLELEGPLRGPGRITVRHASQVVTMEDAPATAFKAKKDSSMRVAFNLAASGEAEAVVSAGNSGAVMAHGVFVMKRIDGVERPGIVTVGPTRPGGHCVVIDVGANTELKPSMMAQFAVLGAAYARVLLGTRRPRVGVLSNGEEEGKGTELTREAHRLLQAAASSQPPLPLDFEFAGYAEGRDFFPGRFDVIVTDGFTGNIALKTYEGDRALRLRPPRAGGARPVALPARCVAAHAGVPRAQAAPGVRRVRWGAVARGPGRGHDLPRELDGKGDQERHLRRRSPGGCRPAAGADRGHRAAPAHLGVRGRSGAGPHRQPGGGRRQRGSGEDMNTRRRSDQRGDRRER